MQQPVIYVDLLFLTNLAIDYMLLFAVGKAATSTLRQWRLLCSALLGAVYSLLVVWPSLTALYHPLAKLLFSGVMIAVSYPFSGWRKYLQQFFYFYVISLAFAGAAEFANHYFAVIKVYHGMIYFESSIWLLILSCVAAYFLFPFFMKLTTARYRRNAMIREVLVERNGKRVVLKGLIDTGNTLCDPLNGKPVMIAELSQLLPLFEEEEILFFQNDFVEQNTIPVRLIPYRALGIHSLLKCFVPDRTVILGEQPTEADWMIGVKNEKLSPNGEFHALLHSSAEP